MRMFVWTMVILLFSLHLALVGLEISLHIAEIPTQHTWGDERIQRQDYELKEKNRIVHHTSPHSLWPFWSQIFTHLPSSQPRSMNAFSILIAFVSVLIAVRLASTDWTSRIDAIEFEFPGGGLPTLAPNHRLTAQLEKQFIDEIVAPEHFAFRDGWIYFSQSMTDDRQNRRQSPSDKRRHALSMANSFCFIFR